MPTRLVREGIISSDRIEQLDYPAEVFYRRLLNKVDDHGLYDARPSFLRATLYPMRIDRVREADISRWMAACQKAGLIVLYEAENKPYLCLLNTGWEKRSKPKYPLPPENICKQEKTVVPVVVDGVVVVDEGKASSGKPDYPPGFVKFWTAWPKTERKQGKGKCFALWKQKKLEDQSDVILKHVERMSKSESWMTGFDPLPETYLRGQRWDGAELDATANLLGECQWNVNGNRDPYAGKCTAMAVMKKNDTPYCKDHGNRV